MSCGVTLQGGPGTWGSDQVMAILEVVGVHFPPPTFACAEIDRTLRNARGSGCGRGEATRIGGAVEEGGNWVGQPRDRLVGTWYEQKR
jgi:hypothetical protein